MKNAKKTKTTKSVKINLNPALVKEAAAVDQQLRHVVGAFSLARRAFGEICLKIKAHKLHRFIQNPKSRKNYISMWAYVQSRVGKDISRATMFNAMKIAKLTKGPHAIPAKVVDRMPVGNATKIAEVPAHKRTLQLVKKATTQAPAAFKKTADKASGKKPAPAVFSIKLHPIVIGKLKRAIDSFRGKVGEGKLTIDDVAVVKLCKAAEVGKKALAEQAKVTKQLQKTINASAAKIEEKKAPEKVA